MNPEIIPGYLGIVAAIRTHDKTSDIYSSTSDNQEDLDARSLNLYQRNFRVLLKDNYSITETLTPNKPVPEADLVVKEDAVSEVQAAKIAFADLMKEYGDVLEIKEFSVAHWIAKKRHTIRSLCGRSR